MSTRMQRSEMPSDPAAAVRALRACRDAMIRIMIEVRIGSPSYEDAYRVLMAIHALADGLTGIPDYFHQPGAGATDGERHVEAEKAARERGEIQWER
jgi:hypothetical protein